jgi:cyclophilin family peptidyl-prolyl cis-trans isomerase
VAKCKVFGVNQGSLHAVAARLIFIGSAWRRPTGDFVIEVHREWAPVGAARFEELVRKKYFDDSRFFRVVAGRWRERTIADDVLRQSNTRGFVAFANTGAGTRSTEAFINLGDNSARNDKEAGFAPFGVVAGKQEPMFEEVGSVEEGSGQAVRAMWNSWAMGRIAMVMGMVTGGRGGGWVR